MLAEPTHYNMTRITMLCTIYCDSFALWASVDEMHKDMVNAEAFEGYWNRTRRNSCHDYILVALAILTSAEH